MARWIEIPAHRVLELTDEEFQLGYRTLNTEGQPARFGEIVYRVERKSDGKLFMVPRYHEAADNLAGLVFLEEI